VAFLAVTLEIPRSAERAVMAMKKHMRVNLTIEGTTEEVMDVVGLAMAGNILKEYHVDEDHIQVRDAADFINPNRRRRSFEVGDRVRFNGAAAKYGMHGGEIGTITNVLMTGRRSKVAVRWDDNTENEVGGSYLTVVKAK
jgi:hypothetical protein